MGATVGGTILAMGIGLAGYLRPDMVVLYQNIDLKDSSAIAQVLDSQKIPYNVIDGGTTIEVEDVNLSIARLALATENIPKSGYTFDDAITNSMSTTEDEKKAKLVEYKKAEIEKALESMSFIRDAEVTLEIPKDKNSFIASKQKSRASVMLDVAMTPNNKQISGVARFLASSVENLTVDNITIIDTDGNNLFIGSESGEGYGVDKQQEMKLSAEKNIIDKVTKLLSPLYEDINVGANLVLDFSHKEELLEEYNPQFDGSGKGIIKNESTTSSSSTNTGGGAEPGVGPNTGAPTIQVGGNNSGESKSSTKDTEYVNDKVVSNYIKNIGDIDYDKSSIAVNVVKKKTYTEDTVVSTLTEGTSWADFKLSNSSEVETVVPDNVVEQIKKATGIDNVVVSGYEIAEFIDSTEEKVDMKDYMLYIALMAVVLGLIATKFGKKKKVIETEPELEVEEMLVVNNQPEELDDIELKETLETKNRIDKFVDEKPEAVANLLRNWLTDDWD